MLDVLISCSSFSFQFWPSPAKEGGGGGREEGGKEGEFIALPAQW